MPRGGEARTSTAYPQGFRLLKIYLSTLNINDRQKRAERALPPAGPPQKASVAGLDQAKARGQDFHPGLPRGGKGC